MGQNYHVKLKLECRTQQICPKQRLDSFLTEVLSGRWCSPAVDSLETNPTVDRSDDPPFLWDCKPPHLSYWDPFYSSPRYHGNSTFRGEATISWILTIDPDPVPKKNVKPQVWGAQDFYGYLKGLGMSRSRYSSPAFRQRALRHWGYAILPCIAPARRMVRPVPENHKDLGMSYQDTWRKQTLRRMTEISDLCIWSLKDGTTISSILRCNCSCFQLVESRQFDLLKTTSKSYGNGPLKVPETS